MNTKVAGFRWFSIVVFSASEGLNLILVQMVIMRVRKLMMGLFVGFCTVMLAMHCNYIDKCARYLTRFDIISFLG